MFLRHARSCHLCYFSTIPIIMSLFNSQKYVCTSYNIIDSCVARNLCIHRRLCTTLANMTKYKSNVSVPIQVPSSGKERDRETIEHRNIKVTVECPAWNVLKTLCVDGYTLLTMRRHYSSVEHKDTLNREQGLLPSVYRGLMVSHSS